MAFCLLGFLPGWMELSRNLYPHILTASSSSVVVPTLVVPVLRGRPAPSDEVDVADPLACAPAFVEGRVGGKMCHFVLICYIPACLK